MLFLIILSPFLFYFWHKETTTPYIAKREAALTLLNVLLLGIIGSLLTAKINALLLNGVISLPPEQFTYMEGQRLYGGIVFVIIYYVFFYDKNGLNILDSLALTICPLLSVGKLGCFFAGHIGCAGTLANTFGCWYYDIEQNGYIYLIPKQLIDSIFYLVLFIYLLIKSRKNKGSYGLAFDFTLLVGLYLFAIGFWANESYISKPFRINQLYALLLLCIAYYIRPTSIKQIPSIT